jgi:flagellar basal-body rod protein FlgB
MERAMTIANRRMDLVAGNLANIDTPGYRTRDIDFQESLKSALQGLPGQDLPMVRTDPRHLGGGSGGVVIQPQAVATGQERNDGNNVNLDRETMILQRTQSSYVLASTFLQGEVRRTLQAIRDAKA